MPAPEDTETNTIQNDSNIQEPSSRELTQTDRINKKLLTSLFNRMDEGGDTSLSKMLEPDNKIEDDDEWKD